jgi:hypothetical protein
MQRMKWRYGLIACIALAGCNHDAVPNGGNDLSLAGNADLAQLPGADFAVPPGSDLAMLAMPDFAGNTFCGGNTAQIQLNNMLAQSPSVDARLQALNCCDAATLEWTSMQIAQPIVLAWRHQVGQGPNPPVVLDLANLPMGWSAQLFSGCNPYVDQNCMPTDRYDNGLAGTLTIDGNFANLTMTACVSANEGGNPHPVMHNVQAWTPSVTAK